MAHKGTFQAEKHLDTSGAGKNAPANLPESNKSRDPGYPVGGSLGGAGRNALTKGFTAMGAIDGKSDPANTL